MALALAVAEAKVTLFVEVGAWIYGVVSQVIWRAEWRLHACPSEICDTILPVLVGAWTA